MSTQKNTDPPVFIVGIGASAGGLDALTKLIANLPDHSDRFAIIVAQHVSPDHKSKMVELLARRATWPVVAAEDQVAVQAGKVYVTPPNCEILIEQGTIALKEQHRTVQAVPSVDHFFASLAKDQEQHAIGIILSGTGEDGTQGIREIQQQGGHVMVQAPEEAHHRGMPDAAIRSGQVDQVLSVTHMGKALDQYVNSDEADKKVGAEETSLQGIFRLLTQKTGTDFSHYKSSTIGRRIGRRLEALEIDTIDAYYQHVQQDSEELDRLFATVLIGVTEFFRDKPAYDLLRQYIRQVIKSKQPGDSIRIWSVGCATGEEPYSIAILLAEELGDRQTDYTIQIFATDIDEKALATGRRGFYSEDLMDNLSASQVETYFNRGDKGYELKKAIRQWVLFSKHDITRDPPFVRLDLIACRNVLIYFDNELQRKVIPVFHYALNEDRCLLLGKSENVTQLSDLFTKDRGKQKLFRKKSDVQLNALKYTNFKRPLTRQSSTKEQPVRPELSVVELARETLMHPYNFPYVVVNESMEVVHVEGSLQPYLELRTGALNSSILSLVNKGLHIELRTVFAKAKRESQWLKSNIIRFSAYDQEKLVRLSVRPSLYRKNDQQYYLIIFEPIDALEEYPFSAKELDLSKDEYKSAIRVMELEHELSATKEHLQTFTEELETSNEELQAMNEELQSANEELKSSNEELETSNEELQSTVEELQTANAELGISNENLIEKEAELLQSQEDIRINRDRFTLALENSPVILFYQDTNLRYTWQYNNHPDFKIEDVLGKTDHELLGAAYQELIDLKIKVLTTAEVVHSELTINDKVYDLTIKPDRDKDRIVGIKGVAVDVTERVQAERSVAQNQAIIYSLINESEENVLAVDHDYQVLVTNPAQQEEFHGLFDKNIEVGDNVLELLGEYPDAQSRTQHLFDQALQGKKTNLPQYASTRYDEAGNRRYYDIDVFPIRQSDDAIVGGALLSRDVTVKVLADQQTKTIVAQSANLTGEAFFKNLTQQIYGLFGAKYTYIGLLDQSKEEVCTQALRKRGRLLKNVTYTLPETPCGMVARNEETRYVSNVRQQFPEDAKLKRWDAESYLGIPITSPLNGETLAILVLIDDKPIAEVPNTDYILNIFTLRAGAELERMRAEKQVREKEQQIDNITRNVVDVIYEFVSPAQGEPYFRFVSNAISDIYELSPSDVLQDAQLAYQVVHPEDMEAFTSLRDEVLQGEKTDVLFQGRIITAQTAQVKWVNISAKTERQPNGDIVWYGVIADITTLKKTQEELEQAKERAEAAMRAEEDFMATMSHEIRTPLNAIIGLSDLLLKQEYIPQQQENLEALRFSSQNLMALVNDILDYSKIEAGQMELEYHPFSLHDLLHSLERAHRPQAQERNNRLVVEKGAEVPDQVVGDQIKLSQVLNNLLGNALKFTEGGRVTFTVAVEKNQGEAVDLRFSIEDTGIGISPAKIDRIFSKFTQADNSTSRTYGGTGLGLSITKLLLELMGSRIQVESQEGEGSRFFFSLSVKLADTNIDGTSIEPSSLNDASLPKVRLLLAEDVAVNRMILRQYLSDWDKITIDEAANGKEAVEKVAEHTYDLVLMDVRMPVMDGYEATQIIQGMQDHAKSQVPIIALTADTPKALAQQGATYFTDVITKPFAPEELYRKIIQYTAGNSSAPPSADDVAPAQNVVLDFAQAEAPFSDQAARIKFYQVIHQSLSEAKHTYQEAMQQNNSSQLDDLIHKLQITYQMFGLTTLRRQMEQDHELLTSEDQSSLSRAVAQTMQLFDQVLEQMNDRQKQLKAEG